MNPISITSDLVNLPSYKLENSVGEYIYQYLQQFPYLNLTKQPISRGRFNVIARSPGPPQLLLAGHMDTVVPKQGSGRNPFRATIEQDKLYGLGAYDMKGGIAAILSSLPEAPTPQGLVLLFYCDEEYGFLGMRKFLESDLLPSKPQLALIAEPTDLKIWNTHRGLIEINFAVSGKSGHAANPTAGVNAIDQLQAVLNQLKVWLNSFATPELGATTLNVAFFRGGLNLGNGGDEMQLGRDGNNIADYAEVIIDIRPAVPTLRAADVTSRLKQLIRSAGLKLKRLQTNHDFSALCTDPTQLSKLEQIVGNTYLDASSSGYGDGQLVQEAWGIPVAYFGPQGGNAHAPDEWVDTKSLQILADRYAQIIENYCPTAS